MENKINVNNILSSSLSTTEVMDDDSLYCNCHAPIKVCGTVPVEYEYNPTSNKFELVLVGNVKFHETDVEGIITYCSNCDEQYEDCECADVTDGEISDGVAR